MASGFTTKSTILNEPGKHENGLTLLGLAECYQRDRLFNVLEARSLLLWIEVGKAEWIRHAGCQLLLILLVEGRKRISELIHVGHLVVLRVHELLRMHLRAMS